MKKIIIALAFLLAGVAFAGSVSINKITDPKANMSFKGSAIGDNPTDSVYVRLDGQLIHTELADGEWATPIVNVSQGEHTISASVGGLVAQQTFSLSGGAGDPYKVIQPWGLDTYQAKAQGYYLNPSNARCGLVMGCIDLPNIPNGIKNMVDWYYKRGIWARSM